ncbi:hypothetical protein [Kitasatospora sp. NPDC006786]|uniref:hypothetical protein n=1 Tax=unclassified Kitasatospora TaxID=2633591 RepID=UPI0033D8586A
MDEKQTSQLFEPAGPILVVGRRIQAKLLRAPLSGWWKRGRWIILHFWQGL